MPKNVESILKGYKKIVVCELNGGQMKDLLNKNFNCSATGYNKMQGKPFMIRELVGMMDSTLEAIKK
jgi:2-oxoglutarate ferredoxin oxidoreductase subunit alpha